MFIFAFAAQWGRNFLELCRSAFWAGGNAASLITFAGVTVTNLNPLWLLLPAPIVAISLVSTFPRGFMALRSAMNQPLTLQQAKQVVPQPKYHVGLVGITATGKSSFRGQLANRTSLASTTTNLVELVSVPLKNGPVAIALYDSVGQNFDAMFQIARVVDHLIFFIDHSESSDDPTLKVARLTNHRMFATQLNRVLEGLSASSRPVVWVVATKSDLLPQNGSTHKRVAGLRARLRNLFAKTLGDKNAHAFGDYSNRTAGDAVRLLTQVLDD